MKNAKNPWTLAHKKSRFRPKYPSESVVRFINSSFYKDRSKKKILDIGCGAGRHVKFLSENKFRAYGVEISKTGIYYTKKLLSQHNLKAEVTYSDMSNLPFKDNYFDATISYGVFCYTDSKGVKNSINEMYRVMKKGGKSFINLRSTNDYRYGKGKKIEQNTFILNIKETNEYNQTMHFLTKKNILTYFNKFKKIEIALNEFSYNNMKILNSDWLISVIK